MNSNNQENIQSTDTFFHMKSVRFHCTPCNRQFSFLNPENGRAICPRCERVSTRIVESNTQSQMRNGTSTTNTRQTSERSQTRQQQQQRPFSQSYTRPTSFSNGPGAFIQTVLPGVFFMQPEYEQVYPEQNDFGSMFGYGNMFGMNQNNLFSGFYSNFSQPYSQYSSDPFDFFGGFNGGTQGSARPMYRMGDQYITPEEYERLVEEFIQSDPNQYGPPPASEENIKKLKEFSYISDSCKTPDCTVCQDSYTKGDKCIELPCEHTYHKDCVLEWLKRHDSCPVCRTPSSSKQVVNSNAMEEEAC